jgi:hypothetical protein
MCTCWQGCATQQQQQHQGLVWVTQQVAQTCRRLAGQHPLQGQQQHPGSSREAADAGAVGVLSSSSSSSARRQRMWLLVKQQA